MDPDLKFPHQAFVRKQIACKSNCSLWVGQQHWNGLHTGHANDTQSSHHEMIRSIELIVACVCDIMIKKALESSPGRFSGGCCFEYQF